MPPRLTSPEDEELTVGVATPVVNLNSGEGNALYVNPIRFGKYHGLVTKSVLFAIVLINCGLFWSTFHAPAKMSPVDSLAKIEKDLQAAQVELQAEIEEQELIIREATLRVAFLKEQKRHTVVIKPNETKPESMESSMDQKQTALNRVRDLANRTIDEMHSIRYSYSSKEKTESQETAEKMLEEIISEAGKAINDSMHCEMNIKQFKTQIVKYVRRNELLGQTMIVPCLFIALNAIVWWRFKLPLKAKQA